MQSSRVDYFKARDCRARVGWPANMRASGPGHLCIIRARQIKRASQRRNDARLRECVMDLKGLPKYAIAGAPATRADIEAASRGLPAGMPGELAALLAVADGIEANDFIIYDCELLPEQNETYEVGLYAPGYVAFGDDGRGSALMMRG